MPWVGGTTDSLTECDVASTFGGRPARAVAEVSHQVPLPNFLYVGVDKAGSTWLYKALRQHAQVYVPTAKDLYFFDREYERGVDWYRSFFLAAPPSARRLGEICHDYLHSPVAPERIAATLPGVQIVMTLREPVARTRSAYLHSRKIGATELEFEHALDRHPWMWQRSCYADSVGRYLDLFGERVSVLFFDDLAVNPEAFFDQVCDVLAIDRLPRHSIDLTAEQVARAPRHATMNRVAKRAAVALRTRGHVELLGRIKHSRSVQRALYRDGVDQIVTPEMATRLRAEFAGDVARLDSLLGQDVSTRWGFTAAHVDAHR